MNSSEKEALVSDALNALMDIDKDQCIKRHFVKVNGGDITLNFEYLSKQYFKVIKNVFDKIKRYVNNHSSNFYYGRTVKKEIIHNEYNHNKGCFKIIIKDCMVSNIKEVISDINEIVYYSIYG